MDPKTAIAAVTEYLRQFSRLKDTGGVIHSVWTDPESEAGAVLTEEHLRALLWDIADRTERED